MTDPDPDPDFNHPEGVRDLSSYQEIPEDQRIQVFDLTDMAFLIACYRDGRTIISGGPGVTPAGVARNLRLLADHVEGKTVGRDHG